jgi:transposase InsO family protein
MYKNAEDPTVGSQYTVNGRIMEVIHVDTELVTLRDLERTQTLTLKIDAMNAEISKQTIVQFTRPPGAGSKALAFLNPHDPQVIAAIRKHRYVDAAHKKFGGPLPQNATNALIIQVSLEIGDSSPPCYNSVYNRSKHYKKHNCDPFCLLKEQSFAPRGKRLDPEVEEIIGEMIDTQYRDTIPPVKPITIFRFIEGQVSLINLHRSPHSSLLLRPPSLSTIQRRIRKLCAQTSEAARYGQNYVKKNHSSTRLSYQPEEVLDLAEIDTHQLKIVVVDEKGNILGKILYWTVILEIKTRCVIGWELSPTYPCAEKTIRALMKALIAVHGEERQRGKPTYLHSDNGSEFNNSTIRHFLDRLNISFERSPPYTPNARARIERFFETFELWLHEQAGTTMSNPTKCEFYDSESEASYTSENMNRHVEDWIEKIYHKRKHRTLNIPPAVAWERAMKNRLPPEKFTAEDLDILCRTVTESSISAAGRVHFLCLSWHGPGLPEIRSKLKKGQRAICYYNPLDLGEIWVAHPDTPRNPQRAYATRPDYQNGLTKTEHDLLHKQYLSEGREFNDSEANVELLRLRQRMSQEYDKFQQLRKGAKSTKQDKTKISEINHYTSIEITQITTHDDSTPPTFEVEQL